MMGMTLKADSLQVNIKQLNIEFGKSIFRRDCRVCHAMKGRLHDYLDGVVGRVGEQYLKLYLTNQDSLTRAKDKYAIDLKERMGNMANSHNYKFSEAELKALIEYLK